MGIVVPRLSEAEIEAQAISVLERYASEVEPILRPPVPVDEIPERLLRLRLDFDDLRTMLGGSSDAIGAIWFERREIFIDQSLDPFEHPSKKGRYHFTIGHEIGHWVLHRRHVPNRESQLGLFAGEAPAPSILCRVSNQKEPVEWQADRFSSYLLMPRNLVLQAWREHHGTSPWQFDLQKYKASVYNGIVGGYDEVARKVMNHMASDFASIFGVSREAMRIRLEVLGLLKKVQGGQLLNLEKAG